MRICSLFVLPLALCLSACDTSTPAIRPPDAPVLSLAVGTEWTVMQVSSVRFDPDTGAPLDTTDLRSRSRTRVITVTRDTVIAGETWALIEPDGSFGHCVFGHSAWYANRPDGLYRWRDSVADAERVYGIGVAEGDVFLDTPIVTAILTDDDAVYALPTGPVVARQYDRTWRQLEFNETIRGPIDPNAASRDYLSPELGPVALEVSYARQKSEGQFAPASTIRYELAPTAMSGATAELSGAYPVR